MLFSGWLTVGPNLTSSNFSSETYKSNFNNGPDDYLVGSTQEIESLRPKSPVAKNKGENSGRGGSTRGGSRGGSGRGGSRGGRGAAGGRGSNRGGGYQGNGRGFQQRWLANDWYHIMKYIKLSHANDI